MVPRHMLSAAAVFCLASAALGQAPVPAPSYAEVPAASPGHVQGATPADASAPLEHVWDSSGASFGDEGRFWVRGDYLVWWLKGAQLPPLLTSSPPGTALSQAGLLNGQGTTVLFGNEKVNDDERSGFRVYLGAWLDADRTLGIEGSFFLLEGQGNGRTVGPDGIFARPFTNAVTGQPDAQLVSFPGTVSGTATATASSTGLLGFDVLLRERVYCCCGWRLDTLAGYRYLRYDDTVGVTETLNPLTAPFVPGTQIVVGDSFRAENTFQGLALGVALEYDHNPWTVGATARVSVGQVFREVSIDGATTVTVPGVAPVVNTGGLLALPTNIGRFRDADWTAVPELELHAGYRFNEHLSVRGGYSLLYWPKVARAAEQIDTSVNRNLIPPASDPTSVPARPGFSFNDSGMWAQGFSLQLVWKF